MVSSMADATSCFKPSSKLSLLFLPPKPEDPPGMPTPPLRPPAAVPFLWEEAPGKPRVTSVCSFAASSRTLHPPPRLLYETRFSAASHCPPTTLLGSPYAGRSASCSYFRDSGLRTLKPSTAAGGSSLGRKKEGLMGIWRNRGGRRVSAARMDGGGDLGGTEIGVSSSSSSAGAGGGGGGGAGGGAGGGRFKGDSSANFWTTVYGSIRHVLSWKVGKQRKRDGVP